MRYAEDPSAAYGDIHEDNESSFINDQVKQANLDKLIRDLRSKKFRGETKGVLEVLTLFRSRVKKAQRAIRRAYDSIIDLPEDVREVMKAQEMAKCGLWSESEVSAAVVGFNHRNAKKGKKAKAIEN